VPLDWLEYGSGDTLPIHLRQNRGGKVAILPAMIWWRQAAMAQYTSRNMA